MASHTNEERTHDPSHHIVSVKTYVFTLAALLVLMALTIGVSYRDLGALNIPIALLIAVTKAVLVVLFFMGVKFGTRLTMLWASIGFIWFLLMFGTLGDYVSRNWIHLPQGW